MKIFHSWKYMLQWWKYFSGCKAVSTLLHWTVVQGETLPLPGPDGPIIILGSWGLLRKSTRETITRLVHSHWSRVPGADLSLGPEFWIRVDQPVTWDLWDSPCYCWLTLLYLISQLLCGALVAVVVMWPVESRAWHWAQCSSQTSLSRHPAGHPLCSSQLILSPPAPC